MTAIQQEICHRPLIPLLLGFAGGIFISHEFLNANPGCGLLSLALCVFFLLVLQFVSRRFKFPLILMIFLMAGILLGRSSHPPSRLLPLAGSKRKVTIEGVLLEPPKIINQNGSLKVRANRIFSSWGTLNVNEDLLVKVYGHVPVLRCGEKIRFPARLKPFKNFNNPGCYDYELAMKLRGISCGASVTDGRRIVPMGPGQLPFPGRIMEKLRQPVRDLSAKVLDGDRQALLRTLLLGERQSITPRLRELFNRSGLGHVLAVSGLHIGLLAWCSFFFFKGLLSRSYTLTLRIDIRKAAALITMLPVIAYTLLAGFQVSSQRAMIMVLAYLCSLVMDREKETWSTLALAGLIILALEPLALFSISFQLSFAAVTGILWLTPAIMDRVPNVSDRWPLFRKVFRNLVGLAAVSLSANIFLFPILAFYFHRISLTAIPANITLIPVLGGWVIPLGFMSAITLPLSEPVASLFLRASGWGLHTMIGIVRFWSDLSWSSLWVLTPSLLEMLLYYALLFCLFFFRRTCWARRAVVVLALLLLADAGYWIHRVKYNHDLRVTFLDVGQGSAALIELPGGKKMLIDGGGFPGGHFDVGRMVVAPFLWHSKICRIDYLVLSHPQADHMNGLRFIAAQFAPREFWSNGDTVSTASFRELVQIINSKKIKKYLPEELKKGRMINGAHVEVLHPMPGSGVLEESHTSNNLNNRSLVLRISYGGKSFMFPGDIEKDAEKTLILRYGDRLTSDILLAPHHGSNTSSSLLFLKKVRPQACIISARGAHFGFPHPKTLERLRKIGCKVLRIDRCGAVRCRAGPNLLEISTFLGK